MSENIFEVASRAKTRFTYKGIISVDDLWDLSVQELDKIFRFYNSALKSEKEESLLGPKGKVTSDLELKVALVRHVVEVKLAEAAARQLTSERASKKRRILEILARKQDDALTAKTEEELKKMLDEI